ncbi:MAG: hypothetical protein KF850_38740, partial [Labilithrix sp.]|nr:hypothetical protein [Labilithrix sp.]
YCSAGSQFCCAKPAGGNNKTYACVTTNPQCSTGIPIRCAHRSDCPGTQVCCGEFSQTTGYRSVSCQAACTNSPIPGTSSVRFCDKNAAVDECADIGLTCQSSGSLDGFAVCR